MHEPGIYACFYRARSTKKILITVECVQSSRETAHCRGRIEGNTKSEQRRAALGPSSLRLPMFSKACTPDT